METETITEHLFAATEHPMKVAYVLTSQGCDFYSAMTRVSVASLRISNPKMSILVACDMDSATAMTETHDPLLEEIDNLLVFETPQGDAVFRNRHIKTRLRQLIDGPFLFLDSDTLIRGDLSSIFAIDTDIAGACNHSRKILEEQIWYQDLETLVGMNWQIGQEVYINGGVLFYNDTPKAHEFAKIWHQKWMQSSHQRQNYRDQPALNAALFETQPRLEVLSEQFNAQFKGETSVAKDGVVWHFYSSQNEVPITAFEVVVQRILSRGKINQQEIKAMINRCHPWRCEFWLDDWVGKGVMQKGRLDFEDKIWLEGKRGKSLLLRLRREVRSIKFIKNLKFNFPSRPS